MRPDAPVKQAASITNSFGVAKPLRSIKIWAIPVKKEESSMKPKSLIFIASLVFALESTPGLCGVSTEDF
jgi:hypothetical protein